MDFVKGYKVQENSDGSGYTIVFFLDQNYTEFADEFGPHNLHSGQTNDNIKEFVKQRFPDKKITKVKFFVGSLLIMSFVLTANPAAAQTVTDSSPQQSDVENVHIVQSGETLSHIAKAYHTTVDQLKSINKLRTDTIYAGQAIKVPVSYTQNTVSYQVKSGDTLSGIAKQYHTTVDQIKQTNQLTSDVIYVGQSLTIPTNQGEAPTPAQPDVADTQDHVVSAGESLSLLAKNYNVSVQAIKSANNLSSDTIYVGQTLTIPTRQTETPTPSQPDMTDTRNHVVSAGESLSLLAKNYNVSVQAIKSANNLTSDTIYVGQHLKIPIAGSQDSALNYTVKAGDSLSEIARDYNVTVQQIQSANQLSGTTIYVGQNLMIPTAQQAPSPPPASSGNLAQGVEGPEVTTLQTDLKALGYFNEQATGYFGTVTEGSVKNFQRDYGLKETGVVDNQTQSQIDHAIVKHRLVSDLNSYTGVPYVWGGTSPSGFDCSGFVYFMFNKHGVDMTRSTSSALYNMGTKVSRSDLQPGDLVYFAVNRSGTISHVGFYTGNNSFVSATSSKGIWEYSMDNNYWSKYYVGANRIY
ncbi:LysM peptidoglycan-binding domain-containing protein [Bacillaceae bacterium W0354]